MIYSKLTNPKYRTIVKALILLIIASFNSCMTYETRNFTPEEFVKENETTNMEVCQIHTKTDSTIYVSENKTLTYLSSYEDLGKVLLINSLDTIFRGNTKSYSLKNSNTVLKLNEIIYIKAERQKFDAGKTIFLALGIAALTALIIYAITLKAWSDAWGNIR